MVEKWKKGITRKTDKLAARGKKAAREGRMNM